MITLELNGAMTKLSSDCATSIKASNSMEEVISVKYQHFNITHSKHRISISTVFKIYGVVNEDLMKIKIC